MSTSPAAEIFSSQFPELDAGELLLRALRPQDAKHLFAIFSDPQVTEHYDLDTLTEESQARALIEKFTHRFERGIGLRWAIVRPDAPDVVLGTCGCNIWIQPSARAILGYDLGRHHWRQGVMSQALRATFGFGFTRMALNRVEALSFAENTASQRLLEKLGFSFEGMLRKYELVKGRFVDMAMYSLLRREFNP